MAGARCRRTHVIRGISYRDGKLMPGPGIRPLPNAEWSILDRSMRKSPLTVRAEQKEFVQVVASLGCGGSRELPPPCLQSPGHQAESVEPGRRCSPHGTSFTLQVSRKIAWLSGARERMSRAIATLQSKLRSDRFCDRLILSAKQTEKKSFPRSRASIHPIGNRSAASSCSDAPAIATSGHRIRSAHHEAPGRAC